MAAAAALGAPAAILTSASTTPKRRSAQAAEKLGKDLAYLFSGDYLSACDLSTALSRLIPAVVRGDIKPRLARTVAYMVQTLMQTIHLSRDEYINAFDTDGWRKAVRTSVNGNHDYLFPPDPEPDRPAPSQAQPPTQPQARPATSTSVGAGLARPDRTSQPSAPVPASSSVAARLQPATSAPATHTTAPPNARPSRPQQSAPATPQPRNATRPSPATVEEALAVARELFPARPSSTPAQSATPVEACHPVYPEGRREGSEGSRLISAPAKSIEPATNPAVPPHPQPRSSTPNRDPYALHFDHNCRLRVHGKLL